MLAWILKSKIPISLPGLTAELWINSPENFINSKD
jgi:hypothetical protein